MSRIAKVPVVIPSNVTVTMNNGTMTAKGPKGENTKVFKDNVAIAIENNTITLSISENADLFTKALWGTYASHIRNMIEGVTVGFTKKLILEGVGYKSNVVGQNLELALGFSHPVKVEIPSTLTVTADKNVISITGYDKETVGQFAAYVRSLKKPEPYKGKGMRYENEIIRRKEGKKNV